MKLTVKIITKNNACQSHAQGEKKRESCAWSTAKAGTNKEKERINTARARETGKMRDRERAGGGEYSQSQIYRETGKMRERERAGGGEERETRERRGAGGGAERREGEMRNVEGYNQRI